MIELDARTSLHAPGALLVDDVLVVADVHAGYVNTLRQRGFALPAVDDGALHDRVRRLVRALSPSRIVIAGDLVHGAAAATSRTGDTADLDALIECFGGRPIDVVPGNHDAPVIAELAARGLRASREVRIGGDLVRHGDEPTEVLARVREGARRSHARLILGHFHPALSVRGGPGVRTRLHAFAWCDGLIALPALSPFARGADLLREDYAAALCAVAPAEELETAVVVGAEVIRTGTLAKVRGVSSRRGRRR